MTHAVVAEQVPPALAGERLDRFISLVTDCSRSEARTLIGDGAVKVSGTPIHKASHRLKAGDVVVMDDDPRRVQPLPAPDDRVEFTVVHEDDDLVVIDKPAGLVVHPGPGHPDRTLVNGLLACFPEIATVGEPQRPGLVHRLDRDTSGLLVVARSDDAHRLLVQQLSSHTVERVYTAIVWGHPANPLGVVDAPVGRSRRDPLRMTVAMDGREARTRYRVDRVHNEPVPTALITCELETGRTHQIRVHLSSIGHPVLGDRLYGGVRQSLEVPRPCLHARRLSFVHPASGTVVRYEVDLPEDLNQVLSTLG